MLRSLVPLSFTTALIWMRRLPTLEEKRFQRLFIGSKGGAGQRKRRRERRIRYHTEWRLSSDGAPDAHMSLKAKLEAVIYAADEPVMPAQLAALFADEALEWKAEQDAAAAKAQEAAPPETPQNSASQLNDAFPYLELEPVATGEAEEESKAAGEDVEDESSQSKRPGDSGQSSQETESLPETGEASAEAAAESGPADEAAIEAEAKRAAKLREREVRAVIRQLLDELIAEYAADGRGIEIREIAGGYRMATKPECHDAVRSLVKSQKPPLKLSMPALETLAVIAYKQPVTAPEVNEIRGVDSSGVFGSLLARKLITTAGRKPVVGRPILYKTTREFLLRFGLKDVSELPSMEEFEKMAASELEEPESEASAETAAPATEEFNPDLSVEQNEPAPEAESESNLEGSTQIGEHAPGDPE
jgi:segregation and condensation protein B